MIQLPRAPVDDDELWLLIYALWGVKLPRERVCSNHTSPFEAVAHAYFGRDPNFAVWYASRGSGKSMALSVLGLTKAFVDEADVTILGGSMTQSLNVREHMRAQMRWPNAPMHAVAKDIATLIETKSGTKIRPLPASQTTVRGPHPPMSLLDEVDEMDPDIYQATLGQAMEQETKNKTMAGQKIREYIVASSTWQNPDGTFTAVIEKARDEGTPIYTWCWRELLEEHGGWQSRRAMEAKRRTVSAQMWKTEYELNEPSGASRAFDLDKVEEFFIDYDTIGMPLLRHEEHPDDETWVWQEPQVNGLYAVGTDWAKENDKTVITVCRYDVWPHVIVFARVVNRQPWPVMLAEHNRVIADYQAVSQHDKTGVGSALHDFIDDPSGSGGFVFVGRQRTQMLLEYITEFEHGRYRYPKALMSYYKAHRAVTVADVYAPGKWNSHLPDEIASTGLMNRAVMKMPVPVPDPPMVAKTGQRRKVDEQFHISPELPGTWDEQMAVHPAGEGRRLNPTDGIDLMNV